MAEVLPWLSGLWQELITRAREDRLPHALLFVGGRGVGKSQLATQLAHSLLCQHPDDTGRPCGTCQACHLLKAGTHPDLQLIEPEEEGKVIPIDTIRGVGDFLALKGQYGGRQIVIINPAEAMNRFAANSLLKTLEEPTPDALLILVSSQPSLLLPTIRSRCQQVTFTRPAADLAETWLNNELGRGVEAKTLLALAEGSPLEAKRLHEIGGLMARKGLASSWLQLAEGKGNPLENVSAWTELGMGQAVRWLSSWTMDLIRLKSGATTDVIVNTDLLPQLQKVLMELDIQRLFAYLEQITDYGRMSAGQLNTQLALEDLMISWSQQQIRRK